MSRIQAVKVIALLFATLAPRASVGADEAPADLVARVDAYLEPYVEVGHLTGSLLVARGGETLYSGSWGAANVELEVAAGNETRFLVASITKPMTQVIALRLLELGRLAFDDRLSKFLPDFPHADAITLEMLASHQAGIPHRVTTEIEETVPRTAAEMVELAASADFLFEPGTDSAYSSGGYAVLARVLEVASGKSYGQLLEEHVFGPAGMRHSVHPGPGVMVPMRASSYRLTGRGALANAPLKDYSFLVGAGSVYSTPGDLVRMMRTLVTGGYGELVQSQLVDEAGIDWNGRTNGFRAFADYHAGRDLYIALTVNLLTGAGDRIRADLPRLVAGEEIEPRVPVVRAAEVDAKVLAAYEGDYLLRPGSPLTWNVDENGEVDISGWTLIPTSETTFFSPQDYGEITVVRREDGTVERLDWRNGDQVLPMPRVEPGEE